MVNRLFYLVVRSIYKAVVNRLFYLVVRSIYKAVVNRLFYLVVRSIYKAVVNWWLTGSFIWSSVLFIKLLLTGGLPDLLFGRPFYL